MALYQYWRKNLISHYGEIVNCLDLPPLLTYLVSKRAITLDEREEINDRRYTRDKSCHLLEIISDSQKKMYHFIKGLDATGRQHLANSISGKFKLFFTILDLPVLIIIWYMVIK